VNLSFIYFQFRFSLLSLYWWLLEIANGKQWRHEHTACQPTGQVSREKFKYNYGEKNLGRL